MDDKRKHEVLEEGQHPEWVLETQTEGLDIEVTETAPEGSEEEAEA